MTNVSGIREVIRSLKSDAIDQGNARGNEKNSINPIQTNHLFNKH